MAIAITKSKVKPQVVAPVEAEAPQNLADLSLEDLADKYGSLEDQVNALKMNPIFANFADVVKELNARLQKELGPTDEAELTGAHWTLEIGPESKNSRALKEDAIVKLQAILGIETFTKLAKVNIGDIEKYCTPEQVNQVLNSDTGYSGKRKITAIFKG